MKRELTLTDIAGYLPYGLKVMYKNAPQLYDLKQNPYA